MAEYIEREVVLNVLENSLKFSENELDIGEFRKGCIAAIQDDIGNVKHIPTADVVEVVRCKDCIYYNSNCCFNRQWDLESAKEVPFVRENDFCSYGEKALKEREKE